MELDMENTIKKTYVDTNGIAVLVCQKCGAVKREQAHAYKDVKGPVKIECPCGNIYEVSIEFRKFYRKDVKLYGAYSTPADPGRWQDLIVKNISMQGCGFETVKPNLLDPDQEINIEFELDDAKQSLIKKRAVVCSVYKKYVGCKYIELPGAIDQDYGFYLRNL
jgi:hypothetical protein